MILPANSDTLDQGPSLLVSVRSVSEAEIALQGGADIIDVKEPDRGPLGRADESTARQIIERIGPQAPVTIATGEWCEWDSNDRKFAVGLAACAGLVKIGTAGLASLSDWQWRLDSDLSRRFVTANIALVAYADHSQAMSPTIEDIFAFSQQFGSRWVVVDTWNKRGHSLLDCLEAKELECLIAHAHRLDLRLTLAGRLDCQSIERVSELGPDAIGIRGAVCLGGARSERIDGDAIRVVRSKLDRAGKRCAKGNAAGR